MLLLMVNMFIAMLGIGLIIPVLPDFLREFNATGMTAGLLIAAFGLTQFISSPIAGELSDKYGRRKMIIFGLTMFTLSNLIFALATSIPFLYISRLIGGVGAAAMIPSMLAYVADITSEEERGKGLGLIGAAMSLGFVIGPGIGGFLAHFGVRMPFYVSAGVGLAATICTILFVKESLAVEIQLAARQLKEKRQSIVKQFQRSVKSSYFVLLLLVFTLTFGLINFETVFPLYVDAKYGYTAPQIATVITVGALAGTIIQALFIGKLIEIFGEKRLINYTFIFSAICLILMLLSGNFTYMLLVTLVYFTLTAVMRPAINTLLSKSAGNEQGFVAGMNNAYMSLGNIVGPLIAGAIYDVNLNLPYILGAIVLLFGFVLCTVKVKEMKQSKAAGV